MTYRSLYTACLFIALSFTSCGDDEKEPPNQFAVNGEIRPIEKGVTNSYEGENHQGKKVYKWFVTLRSPIDPIHLYYINFIQILMYSDNNNGFLANGTYYFDAASNWNAFTFDFILVSLDIAPNDYFTRKVESGTITVSREGEIYRIAIDVVLEGNIKVKAYYKGKLE